MNTEICITCKSYSYKKGKRSYGFCLRKKAGKRYNDTCSDYRPDITTEYEKECKTPTSPW